MRNNVLQGEAPRKVLQIKVKRVRKFNFLNWQQIVEKLFRCVPFVLYASRRLIFWWCIHTEAFLACAWQLTASMHHTVHHPLLPDWQTWWNLQSPRPLSHSLDLEILINYINLIDTVSLKIYVAWNCVPLIICFLVFFWTARQWRGLARFAIYQSAKNV